MKVIKLELFLFLYLGLQAAGAIQGCPIFLRSSRLSDRMADSYPDLRFYSFEGSDHGTWLAKSLQIDFFDENGRLVLPKSGANPKLEIPKLRAQDRISLAASDFGVRRNEDIAAPCQAREAMELTWDAGKSKDERRYGYLFLCASDQAPKINETRVQYVEPSGLLRSDAFEYFFDQENHMLFNKIYLKQGGVFVPVAQNSDLLIKADIKYFFTMLFKPNDVNSVLEKHRTGPLSVVGSLSFFLKILFFKIRLSLTTDVSFFENAVYVPMFVHLPDGSKDRLQKGSGIVYTWQNFLGTPERIDMPQIQLGEIPDEKEVEARYCGRDDCIFSLLFKLKQDFLKMTFKLKPEQVRQKFFPAWIQNVDRTSFSKFGLGKEERDYYTQRIGAYFETSDLADGEHGWDFWLSLVQNPATQCPIPVRAKKIAIVGKGG